MSSADAAFSKPTTSLLATAYNLTNAGTLTREQAIEWLTRIGQDLPDDFRTACEIWDNKPPGGQTH